MKKRILSLLLVFVFVFVLVGCGKNNTETTYTNPQITNGDSVVFTSTYNEKSFNVTKSEVYDQIRYFGGLSLLLEELDSQLLSTTISEITETDAFYKSRYNRMVYETSSEAEINTLTEAEKAKALEEFEQTYKLMGLDATSVVNYIKLLAARDKAAYNYLKDESTKVKSDYYLTNEALEKYYNDSYNNTAKALVINFTNASDYKKALTSLNLVTYKSELRKYTGTTPLAEVAQSDLSDENTTKVEDSEVLGLFVQIYNQAFPYKTALTEQSVLTNTEFDFNYDTLSTKASSLASYIFSMEEGEYTYTTLKSTTSYSTVYSLIYKLDAGKKAFSSLTEDEMNALKDAYFMERCEDSTVAKTAMAELRSEAGLVFYDKYFAYAYANGYDSSMAWKGIAGSSNLLLKTNSLEISADQFYDYAMNQNNALYILYASILPMEECINNYEMVYGTERDIEKNGSLRKVYYYDTLKKTLETNYNQNTYETEEVYLASQYGYNDFNKALLNHFVASDLKTIWVAETVLDNNDGVYSFSNNALTYATDVLNDLYTNYYNLYSYQINVTTDYNSDYTTDDLTDVYANTQNYNINLTQTQIEDGLASLHTAINQKISGADSATKVAELMSEFVTEYNKNENGDYTQYKQLGFKVSYQKVTSNNSAITYSNYGSTATEQMNAAYKALYNDKMLLDTFNTFAVADSFVSDKNGAHFIAGTKGTDNLKKPSFKYVIAEGDQDKYNAQCANEEDTPTLSQFAAAFNVYYYSLLASDSTTAKDSYGIENYPLPFPSTISFSNYTSKLSSYFFSENYLYQLASDILGNTTDETLKAKFNTIKTVYAYFLEANK